MSLFAPASCRDALWALYAFNYEISRTREVVTETTTGLIRLQWWRDSLEEIYQNETPRQHPILTDLAPVIHRFGLPKDLFFQLIYAREFDLEDVAPGTMEGFIRYADFTATPLNMLAERIVGGSDAEEAVRQVSINYALVGLLRSLPRHVSQRRCMLPEDVLNNHGLSPQKIFDFNQKENLPDVVKEMILRLHDVKGLRSGLLRAYQRLSMMYGAQIRKADFDLFDPVLFKPLPFKALRLWVSGF